MDGGEHGGGVGVGELVAGEGGEPVEEVLGIFGGGMEPGVGDEPLEGFAGGHGQ